MTSAVPVRAFVAHFVPQIVRSTLQSSIIRFSYLGEVIVSTRDVITLIDIRQDRQLYAHAMCVYTSAYAYVLLCVTWVLSTLLGERVSATLLAWLGCSMREGVYRITGHAAVLRLSPLLPKIHPHMYWRSAQMIPENVDKHSFAVVHAITSSSAG
jgi:hypothetical protein